LGRDAGGVFAGRQLKGEPAFCIAGRSVARSGRGVDDHNGGLSYAGAGGILDRPADGSGGGVLGSERR